MECICEWKVSKCQQTEHVRIGELFPLKDYEAFKTLLSGQFCDFHKFVDLQSSCQAVSLSTHVSYVVFLKVRDYIYFKLSFIKLFTCFVCIPLGNFYCVCFCIVLGPF